jgi:hypothetical protein
MARLATFGKDIAKNGKQCCQKWQAALRKLATFDVVQPHKIW